MLANSKMMNFMEKEAINGRRETFTSENGYRVKYKVLVSSTGRKAFLTMVSIEMTRNMARAK